MNQEEGVFLGNLLRQQRKDKGLGLRETARALDTSASYLTDVEKGHRVPSDKKLQLLAHFLALDIAFLRSLAKRADSIVHEVATQDKTTAEKVPSFLRAAKTLMPEDWDELIKSARRMALRREIERGLLTIKRI